MAIPFEIVRNDIVSMRVDAIVNTANPQPIVGSGVDRAIHRKAGAQLLQAREKIGAIPVGDAVMTLGFGLPSKYVIHTVGPAWVDGRRGEAELLALCYRKSLELARQYDCKSVAFPLISTGNYGFPQSLALQIAVREFSAFLMGHEMQIYLVVFGRQAFILSEKLVRSVTSYIDENYIREKNAEEYGQEGELYRRKERRRQDFSENFFGERRKMCVPTESNFRTMGAISEREEIDARLKNLDAGFSETLLKLIDESGKKDSEIYKKANIDRRLFSKIRSNPNYKPSKETVLAFAFALEMSLDETKDFLSRAGFALSHSSKFDVIVEYFLVHHHYNIFEVNTVLFRFDQPTIGG